MSDITTQHPKPETREIPLTQGQVALVDAADYEWLNQFKWHAHKNKGTFYAGRNTPTTNGKRSTIRMHQVICGKGADHINGDGLNNTRGNLRLATHQKNMFNQRMHKDNKSGLKGVSWRKDCKKWRAQIQVNGKSMSLGHFATTEEAARAYDAAAREYFGEFAWLNFKEK